MNYRIRYGGSIFWLIVWAILFFPIALVLLLTNWSVEKGGRRISCEYNGNRFWLGFWVICFFPIAFLLLVHNGFQIEN